MYMICFVSVEIDWAETSELKIENEQLSTKVTVATLAILLNIKNKMSFNLWKTVHWACLRDLSLGSTLFDDIVNIFSSSTILLYADDAVLTLLMTSYKIVWKALKTSFRRFCCGSTPTF